MKYPLFILSGPSTVGKTTIVTELFKRIPQLQKAVTFTTRKPRPGAVEDKEMRYVSEDEFKSAIDNDEFIEWAEVFGKYYGTHKQTLFERLEHGPVILNIDVQGALQLFEKFPEAVSIFIEPDSIDTIWKRLQERAQNQKGFDDVEKRFKTAEKEIRQAKHFSHRVINKQGELQKTLQQVEEIIKTHL